jgi:magnesium-transporting ATPase (P-type)
MIMPFLQYVKEARVVRRQNDLERYTFPDIQERIYVSFLALSLLGAVKETRSWARSYADATMTYGGFDAVRSSANDLHNMLAVIDGRPDIVKKLKNPREAEALRQRNTLPTLAVKRYLRKIEDDYRFLTQLENNLKVHRSDYKSLRRAISGWNRLDSYNKTKTIQKMLHLANDLLPSTDITRKLKELL